MTEYIPTTEVVREDFADFRRNDYFWKSRESLMRRSARRRRQFDRWLAEHDRQVAEAERERINKLLEAGMKDNPLKGGIARAIELIKGEEQ